MGSPFIININETNTSWSATATKSYDLTILYAAKPDGKNWNKVSLTDTSVTPNVDYDDGGVADMDSYREENLLLFETMDQLHEYLGKDAKCVAILYQFRNCCVRTERSVSVCAKMNVTGDFEKVGDTYCTTNDARMWKTYRPYYKMYYSNNTVRDNTYQFTWTNQVYDTGTYADPENTDTFNVYGAGLLTGQHYDTIPYYTEDGKYPVCLENYNDGYIKSRYRNGSIMANSHNSFHKGNSLLLYTFDTSIEINVATKVKNSNSIKTDYKITEGERDVTYRVTPSVGVDSSALKTELVRNGTQSADVIVNIRLPEDLHYKEGSIMIDYSGENCDYLEGELLWTQEVTTEADGSTTLTLRCHVSDINKGLPEIFFDCKIGDDKNPANDIKTDGTSLVVYAEIGAEYSEQNIMAAETHSDSTVITVSITEQEGITKNTDYELVELGEDIEFVLNYGNNVINTTNDIEAIDILPHNGDDRGTDFTGGYRVKKATVVFTSDSDYSSFKSSGKLGFGKNNKTWNTSVESNIAQQNAIIEEIKADYYDVEPVYDDAGRSVTFDFESLNLGTKAYDDSGNLLATAPVLYAYIPEITGKQRMRIEITLTPKKNDGAVTVNNLIESTRVESGVSVKETQNGGNVYHNNFYYRRSAGGSYSNPLVSNTVKVAVVKRIISGTVWMDQDGLYNTQEFVTYNNSIAGADSKILEYPIENVTATLYYADALGQPNYSQTVKNTLDLEVQPVKTDPDGNYRFENLAAGKYIVVFTCIDDDMNQYMYRPSEFDERPLPFENLSVTNYEHATTVRGNKCMEVYNSTDQSKLENATLVSTISMPDKYHIPTVIYTSPNWNLGLYYIDISVKKTWKNMKNGIEDGMKAVFEIKGAQVGTEIYKAVMSVFNNAGTVSCTYAVEGGSTKEMNVSVTEQDYEYYWTVDHLYLQAENGNGAIDYSFAETEVKIHDTNVNEYFIRETYESEDEVSKVRSYSADNTQLLGSVTVQKKTGGGDALDGAEFSIYQVPDKKSESDTSFYEADQGVGSTLTNRYGTARTTESVNKVILGTKSNLDSMTTDDVKYNTRTNELELRKGGTKSYYTVHKELVSGEERYYIYSKEAVSFTYDWILGDKTKYDELAALNIISADKKIEFNGTQYSVSNRLKSEGVREYYVTLPVSSAGAEINSVVQFSNLPLYDKDGQRIYYTVRETKPPKGYLALGDFNLLTGVDLYNNSISAVHDFSFDVENTKQMDLPLTGGNPMGIMVVVGTMLTMLGSCWIIWLINRRKKWGEIE